MNRIWLKLNNPVLLCPHMCFHYLFVYLMNANIFVSFTSAVFSLLKCISTQCSGRTKNQRKNKQQEIFFAETKKAPTTNRKKYLSNWISKEIKHENKFHRKTISIYVLNAKSRANLHNHHFRYRTHTQN